MTSYQTLLKLAKNPHYKFTDEQLAELEEYRKQGVEGPVLHNTTFQKHPTTLKKENDESTND